MVTARRLSNELGIGAQTVRNALVGLWLDGLLNRSMQPSTGKKTDFAYWWSPEGDR